MKLLLALALVGLVRSEVAEKEFVSPIERDYHTDIGIPLAARIKAAEEALDFNDARIVGGAAAKLGKYPYFGGLIIKKSTGNTSVCGSSLVSHERAVTAAHCMRSNKGHAVQLTIVLGSGRLFSGGTRRTTSQYEVHDDYNTYTLENDIAIIGFDFVSYNDNIYSVSLACGTGEFVDRWVYAAGFGQTSDTSEIGHNQFLSDVRLQVISNDECKKSHPVEWIHDTNVCATDVGRGTCYGDSGGPLVADGLLIGITSFGHREGCERSYPIVFTRVTPYTPWILFRFSVILGEGNFKPSEPIS